MKKLISGIILAILIFALSSLSVWAIVNPDSITFGSGSSATYAVFENVDHTGDILFIVEGGAYYAVEPTDYTASQAFVFEVLDTDNTTLISTPLVAYNDRPIGIYQTAAEKTALGLVSGSAYKLRIRGNPLIFASPTGNSVNVTLGTGDYFDNTNLVSGFTPLRNFVINTIVTNMQTYDGVTTYKTMVLGTSYLSVTGGSLFLAGIPGLDSLEPTIFSTSSYPVNRPTISANASYATSLNITSVWGTATSNGFKAISSLFGMGTSDENGGNLFLFVIGVAVSLGIGTKVQSPLVILIILALMPLFGALLGLINLALAFTIAIIIIILGALLFTRNVIS